MKCFCLDCKKITNHEVLFEKSISWTSDDGDITGADIHKLAECKGCEHVTYVRESYIHDDWNHHTQSFDTTVQLFPNPSIDTKPLEKSDLLPEKIRGIYFETLSAIDNELQILATIGLRACIEAIALEKELKGNLVAKINMFVKEGTINQDQANLLHQIRGIGNAAAHQINPGSIETIRKGLEIVEIMFRVIFILPTLELGNK